MSARNFRIAGLAAMAGLVLIGLMAAGYWLASSEPETGRAPQAAARAPAATPAPVVAAQPVMPGTTSMHAAAPPAPEPAIHLRFDRQAISNVPWTFINTPVDDDGLHFSGIYEHNGGTDGYRAILDMPELDYSHFSVALHFMAEEFSLGKSTLLFGGTGYRWFGLSRNDSGNLLVSFNNNSLRMEIADALLETDKWTLVACSVDLKERKVKVSVNGGAASTLELPADFHLEVVGSEFEARDKNWTFTNYSSGNTFHGWVDDLMIYSTSLSEGELKALGSSR